MDLNEEDDDDIKFVGTSQAESSKTTIKFVPHYNALTQSQQYFSSKNNIIYTMTKINNQNLLILIKLRKFTCFGGVY